MKILFAGGGSGGHFYPIIAVAQEVYRLAEEKKLVEVKMIYMSDSPYDERALFENGLEFRKISAGKIRRYRSILNFFDFFKTAGGVLQALLQVFFIYPDVVFGKGGYASFPTLFAAKILGIPVFIHESDSVPGRANLWASKFAKRIAVSYPETALYFPKEKVALTGVPVRREVLHPLTSGGRELLKFSEIIPAILVLGGSQGADRVNEAILKILPELLGKYYVIHQTGLKNLEEMKARASVILEKNQYAYRYKLFGFLGADALAMAAGAADLVISRAGSTALAEIAIWGLPSIIIPIPESISHDQTKNAVAYARTGAGTLIEENNLSPHILFAEIKRIMDDPELMQGMKNCTREFARPDAARLIAAELLSIALKHNE